MEKERKLAIGAFGVGLGLFASYKVSNFLVNLAMDREPPKATKLARVHISGKKTDTEFNKMLETASKQLEAMPLKDVEITSYDGTKLIGHFLEHPNPKRIIIAMHGWRTKWSENFGILAQKWYDHGCSVLFPEQRGQSDSGGEYIGLGTKERFDCQSWVNYIAAQYRNDLPVYLIGVSMGATTVLLTSNLALPECVHGIIADCGYTSIDAEWKHIANNNLHILYNLKKYFADTLFESKIKDETPHITTVDSLKQTNLPVLFVHGSEDHFVPITMTYENYQACKGPKELLIVPGADHCMSFFTEQDKYIETVLNFWKKYD